MPERLTTCQLVIAEQKGYKRELKNLPIEWVKFMAL
jgi:hypothetical protein